MQDDKTLCELIHRCGEGHRPAFQELYQQTSAKLFNAAFMILKETMDAEEALQESFTKIWYQASTYHRELGHPFAWMSTIVRNSCFDILRRQKRHNSNLDKVALEFNLQTNVFDQMDAESHHSIELEELHKCLNQLPDEQRDSLLMSYYLGLSHSEIVHKIDRPIGTVKSWIKRALLMVRECMNK